MAAMLKRNILFAHLLSLFLFISLLLSALQVQADTEEDGRYWFSVYAQGKLPADKFNWSMDIHPRWRQEGREFDQLILRPAVFYQMNPKTTVWLGYDTIINHPNHQSTQQENRLWQQLTYRFDPVADITFTSRTRLEQRRRENFSDMGHRLRQMVRATMLFAHPQLSLVVWDELFVNLNETDWRAYRGIDQNRLFVGANWKFNDVSNIEMGYINQFVNTKTVDLENHILSTTLRFNF